MGKVEFTRDKLRRQLSRLIDEYEAMIILLAQMNVSNKRRLEDRRIALATASKRQVQFWIEKLTTEIKKVRAETGATRPLGFYRRFLSVQETVVPPGEFILTGLLSRCYRPNRDRHWAKEVCFLAAKSPEERSLR